MQAFVSYQRHHCGLSSKTWNSDRIMSLVDITHVGSEPRSSLSWKYGNAICKMGDYLNGRTTCIGYSEFARSK